MTTTDEEQKARPKKTQGFNYATAMKNNLLEIRNLVNSNHKIHYYTNFIVIGDKSFNGITKEILERNKII